MINIVRREPAEITRTVEPLPGEFDAISNLQEPIKFCVMDIRKIILKEKIWSWSK